jgi:hypothetical protein
MDNHQTRSVSAGLSVSTHNGNEQYWVLVDQMLVRNGPGDQDGLVALGGFVNLTHPLIPVAHKGIGRP